MQRGFVAYSPCWLGCSEAGGMSPHNHPPALRATSRQREGVWSDPAVQLRSDHILAFFVLNSDASRGVSCHETVKIAVFGISWHSLCHEIVFNRLHAVSGREGKSKNHWKMDVSPFSFSTLFSLIVQFFLPGIPYHPPPVIATGPCAPGRERPPSAVKPRTMFERVILKDDGHDGDSPRRTMPVRARHPYGESNVQGKSLY